VFSDLHGAVGAVASGGGVVVAVVLAAAVGHAGWNLMAKAMDDQVVAFWLINLAAALCGVLLVATAGLPARAAWPYLAVSVVLHLGYNTTLLNSYRFGDLAQVYPLSRGIAPLAVTAGAAAFAGEALGGVQLLGVAVIAVGVASIVWLGGGAGSAGRDRRAVVLALCTGLLIAAYSLSDGIGVRHAADPAGYAGVLFVVESTAMVVGLAAWRRRLTPGRPSWRWGLGLGGGVLSVATYSAVLWAQTRLALGVVSALRETSVVVAALLGTLVLHEGRGRWRLLAASVVCAGVAVLVIA
jgi:drug/metabolite transporter (DMT)-like permease